MYDCYHYVVNKDEYITSTAGASIPTYRPLSQPLPIPLPSPPSLRPSTIPPLFPSLLSVVHYAWP